MIDTIIRGKLLFNPASESNKYKKALKLYRNTHLKKGSIIGNFSFMQCSTLHVENTK